VEPNGDRLAIRHRLHRYAMSGKIYRMMVAVVACCIPLMTSLSMASAAEHRSRAVTREFQHEHPCLSIGLTSGRCPGYRKDHVVPLACGGPDAVSNLPMADHRRRQDQGQMGAEDLRSLACSQ
jgi:hypothetical protein